MTNKILNTLDELKQKVYHKVEDYLVEHGEQDIFGYQTQITNLRLIVHHVFLDKDDDGEQTVYVKYTVDNEELVDELYCFTVDDIYNILRNIDHEVE